MLLWIVSNKKMSLSQKIYKLWLCIVLNIGKYLRKGSRITLMCTIVKPKKTDLLKLIRETELLKKKGYCVYLSLTLLDEEIVQQNPELTSLFSQLINTAQTSWNKPYPRILY